MAKDGSIIIDTSIDTSGFEKGTKKLESVSQKATGVAKKLGKAIGAAFAIRGIIQFGKEAIALGSDLQEVQNVVDVTFSTMNEAVNEFARNAAQTAGLSETMAKRYTGTFGAMAQSFNFTEQEAYAMSTSLTQLAGDLASFYNIAQDEAYTKLKSVFTGETETLKDLGVVMTQTALDSYALSQGLGKTTSQMSEQEKVALRYQFVMEQLNGASGDFVRTSGSWANQTRVLALQFESLKASLGQGFINALTPVLQVVNALISRLVTLANAFRAVTAALFGGQAVDTAKNMTAVADSYNEAAAGAGNLAENTKKAAKAAKGYFSGLDEISKFDSVESSGGAAGTGGSLGTDIGIVPIDANVQDGISPKIQAIVDKITALLAPLKNIDLTPLAMAFTNLQTALAPLNQTLFAGLEWFYYNVLVPLAAWTIEDLLPAFLNLLSGAIRVFNEVLTALQPLATWLWDTFLQPIAEWTGGVIVDVINWLADALNRISTWISENQAAVEAITTAVLSFMAAWGIVNLAQLIGGIITSLVTFISTGGLATAVTGGLATAIGFLTSPVTIAVAAIGGLIAAGVTLYRNWDQVKAWLSNTWESIKNKAVTIFQNIKTTISNIMTALKNAIKVPVNGIIGVINGLVSGVVSGINAAIRALNRLSFTVPDWVPLIGGNYFGFNIQELTAPQIPYLATGAVIPPNAPFTAVLGDQKHGNNLEAPESLLRQIVREESGGGGQYRFTAQINRRTLFDEMIAEGKLRQSSTGNNPFALA